MNPAAGIMLMSLFGTALTETSGPSKQPPKRVVRAGSLTGQYLCGLTEEQEAALEGCRVPVFNDAWNYWRLMFSSASGTQPEDIPQKAMAFMTRVSRKMKGEIRHADAVVAKFGETSNPWKTPAYLTAQSNCPGVPFQMRDSDNSPPYHVVFCRFVYRGVEPTIAWPVVKTNIVTPFAGLDCPIQADWALDTVYTPSQVDVPDVKTDSPFSVALDPDNKIDPTQDYMPEASLELKIGAGVAIAVVAALGAAFVLRSVK